MAKIVPKEHGSAHHPGMEGATREGEYWLGLLSTGYSVVDTTIAINTDPSVTQMREAPNVMPGVNTVMCAGAVIHSLGQEPAMTFIQPMVTSASDVTIVWITSDNSAVLALAYGPLSGSAAGAQPSGMGQGVRIITIAP